MSQNPGRLNALFLAATVLLVPVGVRGQASGPLAWQNDLAEIRPADWNYDFAAHLLERAGFGGTPEEVEVLARLTPAQAVARMVRFEGVSRAPLPAFDHSGIHDPGLEPFPPSRPAVTDLAKEKGEALGIKVKPTGNRRLQPVVDKFFYWLRASVLETNRVGYWWANRMLSSPRPLEEKMALFWHGHFASNETKVRDYRKLLGQLEVFQRKGLGSFHDLTISVAQDPAMLSFLDAGVNVKGAANENFAREIMELFTMGVGNYTEQDIREAARAFTGWNYVDLKFVVNKDQHDDGVKTFLGKKGTFDGVEVIDIIMQQPVTADYIAGKIYRYFVREDLSPALQKQLGAVLRDSHYDVATLMEKIFLSRDFYSQASVGTQLKSPVQLAISTYKKLGQTTVPGVPDFNIATGVLGQQLFSSANRRGMGRRPKLDHSRPPSRTRQFRPRYPLPDISFLPPDRYTGGGEVRRVAERIRQGMDISTATKDDNKSDMAESNMNADRDEDFNTRYGSFRGSQLAIQRVKAIPRDTAQIDLSRMVMDAGLQNTTQVVDYFTRPLLSRASGRRRSAQADRVPRQGVGHEQCYCRADLHGRPTAASIALDDESARISACLGGTMSKRFSFSNATRRDLLRAGLYSVCISGASSVPVFGQAAAQLAAQARDNGKILVVLELSGGNDGLNTLVPYGDDTYYKVRPRLGVPRKELRIIDDHFGFSGGMTGFERLYKDGKLAIVHGCGYENPSFSHFTSMAYWHAAAPNSGEEYGWVGRLADEMAPTAPPTELLGEYRCAAVPRSPESQTYADRI